MYALVVRSPELLHLSTVFLPQIPAYGIKGQAPPTKNVLKILIIYLSSRKFYLPSFIIVILIIIIYTNKQKYGKLLFYTDYLDIRSEQTE